MASIHISDYRNSSVLRIYSERDEIQTDPEYQRMGEIWTLDKRQLLIDTILNDFDMPKLYFHQLSEPKQMDGGRIFKYSVIDGRQRLEAIWGFINGQFPLAEGFEFLDRPTILVGGMTYADLAKEYPQLKMQLDSYTLPITTVSTDDLDLIEEMFLRLNEASPLNAAEKRNAMGGPMPEVIRSVANHSFFTTKVSFANNRYQHREMAARLLLLTQTSSVGDTKKVYLDDMVQQFKGNGDAEEANRIGEKVKRILDSAVGIFVNRDILLRAQGTTVIYYQVLKEALLDGWSENMTRDRLSRFDQLRSENMAAAQDNIALANYDLLEFDRMNLQGTNDKSSIEFRTQTLAKFLKS